MSPPFRRPRATSLLTAVIVAIPILGPLPARGAPPAGEPRRAAQEREVDRVVFLAALPGAEVLIPNFKATFYRDGSVTVTGGGRAQVGVPRSGFEFTVDAEQGTYTTRRLSPQEMEIAEPLEGSFSRNPLFARPDGAPRSAVEKSPTLVATVRVQTRDPANLALTQTTDALRWIVNANGTVTWTQYSNGCWSANPSPLNTHWFVGSCTFSAPWYPAATRVCTSSAGTYYNFDFLNVTLRTDVNQNVWICGKSDWFFDYNWTHTDWGEAAGLIGGAVFVN